MTVNGNSTAAKTVVLVTNQYECERIIRCGRTLADLTETELCVFSVQSSKYPQNPLALEYLYNVSKQYGAVMNIAYGEDPVKQITTFIRHNKATHVLTGVPQGEDSILFTIWRKCASILFFTVDAQGATVQVKREDLSALQAALI